MASTRKPSPAPRRTSIGDKDVPAGKAASGAAPREPEVDGAADSVEARSEENRDAAEAAGLAYVSDDGPGISRRRSGKGWRFLAPDGTTVRDAGERRRIEAIGIPPAYGDVWICPQANGHIQATGRDDKGRKQYRYHALWTAARDEAKYAHMSEFGRLLPMIRKRVASDMAKRGFGRDRVLATVVSLLEKTLIRVGNEDYVRDNKSFGLTTLRNRHLDVEGSHLRFEFKGKSGKMWDLDIEDRRIAKVVRSIQELRGQHLFQYVDEDGARRPVTSGDVNDYLREASGGADITAKDFRTWAGTVLASMALGEFEKVDSAALAKKNVKAAIESVAKRLGNTVTICRKCYVHPQVISSYLDGTLLEEIKQEVEAELCEDADQLKPAEAALLGLLSRRISSDVKEGRVAQTTAG